MTPFALPLLSSALLCWPTRAATPRLRAICRSTLTDGRRGRHRRARIGLVLIIAPGLVALVFGGPAMAFAVAVAVVTVRSRWRARHQLRRRMATGWAIADALRGLVAELKAGAHPATAAESAAADAEGSALLVLTDVANAARLGGDVDGALLRRAAESPSLAAVLRPVAHAWALVHRHGLPLADVLDSVCRDLEGRLRFAQQVQARMAGPRASGSVLVALPALGILMGTAMGANPARVLLLTGIGHLLLAIGVGLACTGVVWIAKLTTRAVLP